MDAWPGYCNESEKAGTSKKGKGKDERVDNPLRYNALDHGTIGAASLKKVHDSKYHYTWTFAAENNNEFKLVPSGAPYEVFPPTRPEPLRVPKLVPSQQADKSVHFLRTYYPDVEVPGWLIQQEITHDKKVAPKRNDTIAGNMMDVISFHVADKDHSYLAFPMGETRCQLNMSPLVLHSNTRVQLRATATPIHTFNTPIQQILSSPHAHEIGTIKAAPMLGVRTMGHVTFMHAKFSRRTQTIKVEPLINVQRADIGDRWAVDLTISPSNTAVGYVANDLGSVFRCRASESGIVIEQVRMAESSQPVLCRIASHESREKVAAILDSRVTMLDFRAGKRSYDIFTAPGPGVKLSSIETPNDEDHMVRLVSTDDILWLDERYARRPLLAVKHGREFDLTLRTQTHTLTNSPLTFLMSGRNSLITLYDVSRDNEGMLHMYASPYALPSLVHPDGPHTGFAFYQHPSLTGSKHISLLQLSERGGISLLDLDHVPSAEAIFPRVEQPRFQWTPEVHELGKEANAKRVERGPFAGRVHSIVDMRPAYQTLYSSAKDESLITQSNAVESILDQMPRFWQDPGAPTEHVLTMFDIALRSGEEPADASRNDWSTSSALDSFAGYRALQEGRLLAKQLAQGAPWHLDISTFIHRSVPEFDKDPETTMRNLASYDLAGDPRRPVESYRRETDARSQLALDLHLGSALFSINRPREHASVTPNGTSSLEDDMLSISLSTQAMSLGELEPPPVQFGFLRPVRKASQWRIDNGNHGHGTDENEDYSHLTSPGVRLLLQEWEVGGDPYEYVYRDPYNNSEPSMASRPPAKQPAPPEEKTVPLQIPTQQPPVVASSIQYAPPDISPGQSAFTRRTVVATRSEGALAPWPPPIGSQLMDAAMAPPSSQDEPFASTQVLAGPHGGRPIQDKKKLGKKRLGGF